jgi:hypothetical protein
MNGTKKIAITYLVLSTVFLLQGCGKHLRVNQYPPFYQPAIRQVAVLPFDNQTPHKNLGRIVAGRLASALALNGTYEVTRPGVIDSLLKEKNMPELSKNDYPAVAAQLAKLGKFQAFITGTVLSESFVYSPLTFEGYYDTEEPEDYEDYFGGYGPWGMYPYYYDYETEAYIAVKVSFVRVPDGNVLDTASIEASSNVRGAVPTMSGYASQRAIDDLSKKIVEKFAIVPAAVTVHPDKDLRTADSFNQGKWHFTTTFTSKDELMYAVICLTAAAAQNTFTLTLTPKDNPAYVIVEKNFIWQPNAYCQSVEFSPRQIAASNGPGQYTLQFHSRGKVAMTVNFNIR